jgi:hypothetical protein
MTVLSESKMVRDSYVALFRHTSDDNALVGTAATAAAAFRNVGGSTIASSSEGTAPLDNSDNIGFLVGWACTALSTGTRYVTVESGDGWRGDVGDVTITLTPTATGSTAASYVHILAGPYESARFALVATNTSDSGVEIGQNYIKFSITSDASSDAEAQYVQIKPFRWPDVQYAT